MDNEIYRLRTTNTAAAHALDCLRQFFGLDLIPGEHPADTRKRIEQEIIHERSKYSDLQKRTQQPCS